jgi:hypothetical protein
MKTKPLLLFSSSLELATGIALMANPALVASLLFSAALPPIGEAVGRVGGFGLFSLAIATWPRGEGDHAQSTTALFLYNLMAACYLSYLKFSGEFNGPLLLVACVLHALFAVLFLRPAYESLTNKGAPDTKYP